MSKKSTAAQETTHSKMYSKIKTYYDSGFWTETMVKNAVVKGKITETEYTDITGWIYGE